MTTMSADDLPQSDGEPDTPTHKWERLDDWLSGASEWLNPILVKEARQSLKSRQFVLTFGLLLLAAWGWTALAITMLQSRGLSSNAAAEVFGGYFLILEVPLLVIVPFAAFRSLAGEREDGTFELVSITALPARQIVLGKLASAALQVMIYFSVIAPCIAFTYMLRGIDLLTIALTLIYTLAISFTLVCTGLLFAASVRSIHWQILASVMMLGVLTMAAFGWPAFVFDEMLRGGMPVDDANFWYGNAMAGSMVLCLITLQIACAVAELSFPSDNRSTKLRILLVVIQIVFTGWMLFFHARFSDRYMLIVMSLLTTAFWMITGAMMTAEHPVLSPRVRRSLPRSFLGRMAFTWYNPGSGSGYVFAVTNALGVFLAILFLWSTDGGRRMRPHEVHAAALAVSYMAFYLGIGRMALMLLRRTSQFGVVVGFMVQTLVAVLGILLPILLQTIIHWNEQFNYSALQLPNWGLTLIMALDRPGEVFRNPLFPITVHASAMIVFVLNVVMGAREVHQLREETPDRVLEEDRELAGVPEEQPSEKPKSPFDD